MSKYLVMGLVLGLVSCAPPVTPVITPALPTVVPAASPPPALPAPTQTRGPSAPTAEIPWLEASTMFTLTVLYDNIAYDARLQTDWGFACLVEEPGQTLLFDTGGKGDLLLQNMHTLGLDPQAVDTVVLSHLHNDHTGGLASFLAANPHVTVYLLASFPAALKETVRQAGATLVEVDGPLALNGWAHTTGALGTQIREQALVLATPRGSVVLTGCAHPGIAAMVRQAQTLVSGDTCLALGGFHLRDANAAQLSTVIAELQALGVQQIAPSHCTGDAARQAFAEAFGPAYLSSGAGQVFVIAPEK